MILGGISMITMLAKIFIKNRPAKEQRQAYGTLCSIVGICLNVCLFAGKYFAGILSGSVAITADAFNNLSDAGSSFITLAGFLYAGKTPDSEHPFGHGRFEYVSGFVVAIAILMMGFELLKTSFSKILHPEAVDTSLLAMGILVCSILVKIYMYCYNHYIGKKLDSDAMQATAMDSLSDTIATSVVLAAMIIMRLTSINVDGFGGLLVAIFILYAGIKAVKDTMDPLLGKAPDQTFVREIRAIVMSHPKVHGIHDLIVHDYGPGRRMITLHLEVPGDEDVFQLHDMIDHIERELDQKLGCEAVIHMDPIETNNAAIAQMQQQVEQKVLEIDRRITIHDFRLINCDTHTSIAFDAVIPYGMRIRPEDLKEKIENKLQEIEGNYQFMIHVDQSYVPV